MLDHTPGPWYEEEGWIVDGDKRTICDPRCMDPADPDNLVEMDANARLIAAAPELLEALRECLDILGVNYFPEELVDRGRAILAKLEGD